MRNDMYVRYDNSFQRKKRRKNNNSGLAALIAITAILGVTVAIVLLASLFDGLPKDKAATDPSVTGASGSEESVLIVTVTPTPVESMALSQNPVIYPGTAQINVPMGTPGEGLSPSDWSMTQSIFSGDDELTSFARKDPVFFGDPIDYQSVPGLLTYRGNNFRNCASWGVCPSNPTTLEQVWEFTGIGSLPGSSSGSSWCGTAWTGQAVAIEWSDEVKQVMNMYPDKKTKKDLVEVIQVALDGKIYFFDLEDGSFTRDPLETGFSIKGAPSLDPRGYPILYVGQGDLNSPDAQIGFRIFSLVDYKLLYFQTGLDSRAMRGWGACDSSPIINAATDTLIAPCENGMLYTIKLNTSFDPKTGALSINPENVAFRYLIDGVPKEDIGIESSIAVYDHYGYFCDNHGHLLCVDLNTLKIVWITGLGDDSDVSPVLEEDNGRVYLYVATEVDWQRTDARVYQGASYTYKIDAMTGEEVWQTSADCFTRNGETKMGDINGGALANPILGKKSISDLVIFSYAMTKGELSGNRLVAYNKESGEKVWSYEMNHYSWSSPVDCYDKDGNAYIIMTDTLGQVHLVNGKTGERITYLQTIRNKGTENESKQVLIESSPMVYGDMVIIGSRAGSVFGVKIK